MNGLTIPQALQHAVQHHQAGRLLEAEALYREILARDPRCADALHLLGVISHQRGRHDAAIELLRQAAALAPTNAAIWSNLGEAYRLLGRLDEAVASFKQALALHPGFIDALINLGIALQAQGRPDVAIGWLEKALKLQPSSSNAHYNLGVCLSALGRIDEALVSYQRALALNPDLAAAHNNLGKLLGELGRLDEARASFERAVSLQPGFAEAHFNLGNALRKQEQFDEAGDSYRRAIAVQPGFFDAHSNLGHLLRERGQLDEAIRCYRQALTLKPESPAAHHNLGHALASLGQLEEAIDCYRRALAHDPGFAVCHNNLGTAFLGLRQLGDALDSFQHAIRLDPDFAEANNNLGVVLTQLGRWDESVACLEKAAALKSDFADPHNNLGNLRREQGRLDEAVAHFEQALVLNPNLAAAHNNLGGALKDRGQIAEAITCYRRALALKPDYIEARTNLILALQYRSDREPEAIDAELRQWNERHVRPQAQFLARHANDRTPDRRLRLGYVSGDFREHSVAFFLLPILQARDREQFHVTCYANHTQADDVTARFQTSADKWCDLTGLSDDAAARRIRDDQIDLLVDLSGHTAGNRLLVFARKPAPIQISYLGFPASTGLETMDYRFTDSWADPPDATAGYYSEQRVRLPDTAWCFAPLADGPPVSALPATSLGHVTFGCFNTFAKVTEDMLQLWARILQQIPGSRLVLKNQAVGTPHLTRRLESAFAAFAISADRLELIPRQSSRLAHLQCHSRVDLALDTFPYHGTTTTCEALWMGVPVLTLAGDRHVSRVGVSLLHNVGLPEFVASSPAAYIEAAVAAAQDLPKLAALRASLRERMQRSPLMDTNRFARHLEAAFRTMWLRWCAQPSHPDRIDLVIPC